MENLVLVLLNLLLAFLGGGAVVAALQLLRERAVAAGWAALEWAAAAGALGGAGLALLLLAALALAAPLCASLRTKRNLLVTYVCLAAALGAAELALAAWLATRAAALLHAPPPAPDPQLRALLEEVSLSKPVRPVAIACAMLVAALQGGALAAGAALARRAHVALALRRRYGHILRSDGREPGAQRHTRL